ncbi:MAG: hypothetical protein AB1468_01520 [Candidatus Micrarchaeota archaeon]
MDTKIAILLLGILLIGLVIFGCAGRQEAPPTTPATTPPTTPTAPTETLEEPTLPSDTAIADAENWGNDSAVDNAVGDV